MHTVNIAAFAGVGFLAIGAIFSVSDLTLSRTSFELMAGPIFWIVGCALMVAWAIGRVGHATSHRADTSDEPSSAREQTPPDKRTAKSEADAAGSHRRAAAGQVVPDSLAPLAMWLVVLWFLAAIILLLGYGPG